MAVIEYDSYKQKLLAMDETFENLFKALEIEQARQELNRLELEAHEDGFTATKSSFPRATICSR